MTNVLTVTAEHAMQRVLSKAFPVPIQDNAARSMVSVVQHVFDNLETGTTRTLRVHSPIICTSVATSVTTALRNKIQLGQNLLTNTALRAGVTFHAHRQTASRASVV